MTKEEEREKKSRKIESYLDYYFEMSRRGERVEERADTYDNIYTDRERERERMNNDRGKGDLRRKKDENKLIDIQIN